MTPTTDEQTAARLRQHVTRLAPPMQVDAAAAIVRGRRRRILGATAATGAAAAAVVVAAVAVSTLAPRALVAPADVPAPVPTAASPAVAGVVRPAVGVAASTGPGADDGAAVPLGPLGGVEVVYERPRGAAPAQVLVAGEPRPITLPSGREQVGASSADVAGGRVTVLAVPSALPGARVFLVSEEGWDTGSGRTAAVEVPTFALPGEPSGRRHAVFRVDAEVADGGVDAVLVGTDGTYTTTAACSSPEACTLPPAAVEELRRLTGRDDLRPLGAG
ncbi:hypothetical protein GC089_16680 [Cellulomonas sp. JZ18]|uniref:hypothetical protein n=1 Tax=Cellulomonas sp. JZ18 TaxID=2654191 RepID=UPI0012D38F8E|nr:hypothetical protein [Cellulomonas sp. JZ18]QGQ20522.1 hypothetical protein GC089_16680 [Cellulomonas sp. JZ18]